MRMALWGTGKRETREVASSPNLPPFPLPVSPTLLTWIVLVGVAAPLHAQGFLEQFSYAGLRLSGIAVEMGGVVSDRLTNAPSPAVRVDYGMIAPRVRVLLGASYFEGDFNASEIAKFTQRLRGLVSDPTNDFTINVGQISWSDFETDLDLQYLFPNGPVESYMGLGLGVHVRNGNGTAINGTFVEDALDTIVAGLNLSAGVMVPVVPTFAFTADLRGSLTSELRSVSARAGLMLRFPHRGAP
jgi:hypothetical protein